MQPPRRAGLALLLFLAAAGAALAQPAPTPAPSPPAAGPDLLPALRAGGHVIYIRHARTEREGADQVSAVMGDCATQRMLSEAGWQEARGIGAAFVALRIPVAAVLSSEYCRAWQTADLAFGRHVKTPALNFERAETYDPAQVAAMRARIRPLLGTLPPAGHNTVIVGHDDPFEAATGLYPEPMGVAVVLRPDGRGGATILATIAPDGWRALARD